MLLPILDIKYIPSENTKYGSSVSPQAMQAGVIIIIRHMIYEELHPARHSSPAAKISRG